MVSASDILLRIRGQDSTGNAFNSVEQKANRLKSTMSSAMGMVVGMVGYDLVNSLAESGREAINASQNLDYFAGRLNMSAEQTDEFKGKIDELQKQYRKVDMTAVGASAEEIAMKSGIDATTDNLKNITEMTAVMSSAFVKEGRTQEDAILAVNDALGGQFKRLQELNITEDMLKNNGWSGDLNDQIGLINSLNTTFDEMGYDKTAQDIVTLDDAWQALSVSGGRLLADVVIPLTPAFLAVTEAIIGVIDFVKDNGWAQGAILIGALAIAVVGLSTVMFTAEGAFVGWSALMPGFITSLYGAASGFMAITVAGAPLWAIVAAIAAIALAVYEVGIYFGWWKDVGSMVAAIGDGVRRLWEAFINSPQVQGAIKMIQGALQELWTFLQPLISWLQEQWVNIFGDAGGNPDAIRMIWQAFQQLGNVASTVFTFLQQGFQTVAYLVDPLLQILSRLFYTLMGLSDGSISFETAIVNTFKSIATGLGQFSYRLSQVASTIGRAILNAIVNALRPLASRIWNSLTQSINRFNQFRARVISIVVNAAARVVTSFITRISQIPGRVGAYMMQVPARIASAASSAIAAAVSLATGVVDAVKNGIMGVADTVYNEFMSIPDKINGAVSAAVSAAGNFGNDIKNAVLSALHIASPGIIQRKIAVEFADIPGRIGESSRYVYSAASDYAGNILKGFNAPSMSLSTVGAARQNANYIPRNANNGNTTIVHVHEGAVPVDARNMTEKEAQKIVTLAFESINKDPTGVGN